MRYGLMVVVLAVILGAVRPASAGFVTVQGTALGTISRGYTTYAETYLDPPIVTILSGPANLSFLFSGEVGTGAWSSTGQFTLRINGFGFSGLTGTVYGFNSLVDQGPDEIVFDGYGTTPESGPTGYSWIVSDPTGRMFETGRFADGTIVASLYQVPGIPPLKSYLIDATGTAYVPEPSSFALIGVAFAGLGIVAIRRRGTRRIVPRIG